MNGKKHKLLWCLGAAGIAAIALFMPVQTLMQNPLACVGVGLIGLGLMKEGRDRLAKVSS